MTRFLFVASFLIIGAVNAQRATMPVQLLHYAIDSFSKGKVLLKTGAVSEQVLNYNILTNEMIFNNDGKMLAISDPKGVDTVFIQNRKFVPVNDKFYELLAAGPAPLFLEFTYKIDEPPVSVGYGNASQTTNATSVSSLVSRGQAYEIKLPDDFKVVPGYSYWIRKDDKYFKITNAKQLTSLFPEKKDAINDFVKKNKTNFSKRDDLILLVKQIE